ncbi:hypothetical protein [Desulfosarcina ovata]|uniref:Uncharacterized protein n=1 Tax=Desulfosarcina ovata subsp. ovata TaxID=2752305 RepID=A0A5K8AIZ2_9BACT|nr:hypothetical protein [Desulfosarcina ovata]BBO92466.1 hypothetical protein DSCOOX_56460 [Desulfosarcina ovata subsp. ovata]
MNLQKVVRWVVAGLMLCVSPAFGENSDSAEETVSELDTMVVTA